MNTISRPTITDDDGTGTTGTIQDAAWLSDFQDRIDAALGMNRYTTTATGTQNNWDIDAANSNVQVGILRCNNGSALTINGLVAPSGHRSLIVMAINSSVTFAHEAAGSTAANRITTSASADVSITAGQFSILVYDVTSARWRQTSFGADLTNLNATNLTSGTVPDARLSSNVVSLTGTQTLTNKRITPRITTITSSATPTVNTDNCDCVTITAQAAAITSMTTNLSGTPTNFQKLLYRIKDDGTARAITWGTSFEAKGVSLPTTTVTSKVLTVGFIYDTVTSKWGCVASVQEA